MLSVIFFFYFGTCAGFEKFFPKRSAAEPRGKSVWNLICVKIIKASRWLQTAREHCLYDDPFSVSSAMKSQLCINTLVKYDNISGVTAHSQQLALLLIIFLERHSPRVLYSSVFCPYYDCSCFNIDRSLACVNDSTVKSSQAESQRSRGGAGAEAGGGEKKEDGSWWSRILRVNISFVIWLNCAIRKIVHGIIWHYGVFVYVEHRLRLVSKTKRYFSGRPHIYVRSEAIWIIALI